MRIYTLLLVFLLLAQAGLGQHRFGIMPQINTDFKLGNYLKVNTKLENRFILYQNPLEDAGSRSEYERTDLEVVVTGTRGLLTNFGAGYLIRRNNSDGTFMHRAIQQYSAAQPWGDLLLAHRFRTDQTFEKDEAVQYRLRYRLSLEKPLNGQRVDPREFYLKFNNEYLGSLQDSEANLEIRLLGALGYNHSEDDQLEIGLDYRAENLLGSGTENLLWLTVGWYHSF
ncbi:MAG TPA: DUF2490 domain-containing protein [Candidatus Sphingobacterium stercorigallinarum]|nr:DUF2490 domain-containing protein [Candidatus Sphingobacterium stercorigallinarum]